MVTSLWQVHILQKVLSYPKIRDKYIIDPELQVAIVKRMKQSTAIVRQNIVPPNVLLDREDDILLGYAVAGKSNYFVSGDKRHVLTLPSYADVEIIRPVDFLRIIQP